MSEERVSGAPSSLLPTQESHRVILLLLLFHLGLEKLTVHSLFISISVANNYYNLLIKQLIVIAP